MLFISIMDSLWGPPVGPGDPIPRKPPCSGYQGLIDNCLSLRLRKNASPCIMVDFLPPITGYILFLFFWYPNWKVMEYKYKSITVLLIFYYCFYVEKLKKVRIQSPSITSTCHIFIETINKNPWAIMSQRFPIIPSRFGISDVGHLNRINRNLVQHKT